MIISAGYRIGPEEVEGALIEHRGLPNLIAQQSQLLEVAPGSRVLQFSSFSFDASLFEILMGLCSGATLYLPGVEYQIHTNNLSQWASRKNYSA